MAGWLALVPLVVTAALQALNNSPPSLLAQLELVAPGRAILPAWVLALLSTPLTLGLNLLLFLPVHLATRKHRDGLPHVSATLLIAIVAFQALNALALLLISAALRLLLGLAVLLLGLGWIEAKRQDGSLLEAWRRAGLRLWFNPPACWLALAAGAIIVWPWVIAGSLGSPGTTAANLLQALPNALNEEILFRGFAFAWLWRATRSRPGGAAASLILFVAAQGGTVLPFGDWGALPRFLSALLLGLLCLELTIRAGGSIWPAVAAHLLYDWFRYAFVDPRVLEEILIWLARAWAPLAAGALGMALWIGRKVVGAVRSPSSRARPAGTGGAGP
jgi:membrane protease YdiL (CAAX protease family)